MSLGWAKLKMFFYRLVEEGLLKPVMTTYRLEEMSGMFGETGFFLPDAKNHSAQPMVKIPSTF